MYFRVHHRNAMGRDDNPQTNVKNTAPFLFSSGALIGGPAKQGVFENKIEGGAAYVETESGCDYNAPFVAAMANIVATLDPKTVKPPSVSIKNTPRDAAGRVTLPSVRLTSRGLTVFSNGGGNYTRADIFGATGKKFFSGAIDNTGKSVPFKNPLPAAMYIVRLSGRDGVRLIHINTN
jgi:hypothetical protein